MPAPEMHNRETGYAKFLSQPPREFWKDIDDSWTVTKIFFWELITFGLCMRTGRG